ncbi:hypothetical protein FDP41_001317 [Naegleria fowleri]|uniref:RGS domain-containing protein n=1 Tax=Naegleria fowleri TaxID=5763 RepID=A0A6A5C2Z5_NAEFO|nr:uncharacterized protein FDP41_001317 [Naegleria fowleri]KAF0979649.1 hypothetical protein FDP41_001317 [Naegleria fowleri]
MTTLFNTFQMSQFAPDHSLLMFLTTTTTNNNNNFNTTTTSNPLPCDPYLLNWTSSLPPMMTSINTSTILTMNGFCPETLLSVSIASFELFIFSILTPLTLLGLVWMRKSPHLQARGIYTLVWTIASCSFGIVFPALRWTMGRRIFPCGLYIVIIFNIPQVISLPCICKCLALYAKFKLYRLLDEKKQLVNGVDMMTSDVETLSTMTGIPSATTTIDGMIQNSPNSASQQLPQSIGKDEPSKAQPSTPTVTFQFPSMDSIKENTTSPTTITSNETTERTSLSSFNSRPFSSSDLWKVRVLRFLGSSAFHIMIAVAGFSFHSTLWLLLGVIQYVFPEIADYEVGLWYFSSGCGVHKNTAIMVAVQFSFYLVLSALVLIISWFSDRDTYGIKLETSIVTLFFLFSISGYLILSQFEIIRTLVDYFIPYGQLMVTFTFLELIVYVTIPVLWSIYQSYHQRKNKEDIPLDNKNIVEKILSNKKMFDLLVDFSRRSYCSENVMLYVDIKNYRKATKKETKERIVMHILKNYYERGSPLEINTPHIDRLANELLKLIQSKNTSQIDIFMDRLCEQCVQNMYDVVFRLLFSNEEVRKWVYRKSTVNIEQLDLKI